MKIKQEVPLTADSIMEYRWATHFYSDNTTLSSYNHAKGIVENTKILSVEIENQTI